MTSNYIIYADESWTEEKNPALRYHHFYQGCLLDASYRQAISDFLNLKKSSLGLIKEEIKWSKVTHRNADRVGEIIDLFLDFVDSGKIKYRHLFLDKRNHYPAVRKDPQGYFILYYFFIVWGFGLSVRKNNNQPIQIDFLPDRLPDDPIKQSQFKAFLLNLHKTKRYSNSNFKISNVGQVDSRQHIVLQCCDVIGGSFGYRLNRMDQKKPKGVRRRAKTTIAKAKLYNRIYQRLCKINTKTRGKRGFNAGQSTGMDGSYSNIWDHHVRIWKFTPTGSSINHTWSNKNWLPTL